MWEVKSELFKMYALSVHTDPGLDPWNQIYPDTSHENPVGQIVISQIFQKKNVAKKTTCANKSILGNNMKSTTFSLVYFFFNMAHFDYGVEPNGRVEQEERTER